MAERPTDEQLDNLTAHFADPFYYSPGVLLDLAVRLINEAKLRGVELNRMAPVVRAAEAYVHEWTGMAKTRIDKRQLLIEAVAEYQRKADAPIP